MTGPGRDTASAGGYGRSPRSIAHGFPFKAMLLHAAERPDRASMQREKDPAREGPDPQRKAEVLCT